MTVESLKNLMILANADGVLDDEELLYLEQQRELWQVTPQDFQSMLKAVQQGDVEFYVPETDDECRKLLMQMIQMIWADGNICDVELNLFALAARKLGVNDEELDHLMDLATDGDDNLLL